MAVYDRWHKDPAEGDEACKCRNGRGGRLYPSSGHLKGKRWQVRWRDPASDKQLKRNFALKEGDDANRHAEAFDKLIAAQILTRTYTDPRAGEVPLQKYAETWRKTRTHNAETAGKLAARLRNHVYPDPADPRRTPSGAVPVGQHPMALLSQRPTLAAAWVASLAGPLPAERSRRQVVDDLSAVCAAALQDGIIGRNPFKTDVVPKPGRGGPKAKPFTPAELDAVAAELPPRLRLVPLLGAGTGVRAMELAALGVHDFQFLGRRPRLTVERQLKWIGGKPVFAPVKNRKPHEVPLAPSVARALQEHMAAHPPVTVALPWHDPRDAGRGGRHGTTVTVRLLFLAGGGTPLTRGALQGAWRTAAARAVKAVKTDGARHLTVTGENMHRLRHTYASAQLRAGVDVVRVAAAMGDTVAVVTQTYAHLMRDEDGDGALRDAVDAFFRPGAPDVPSEGAPGESAQAGRG